MTTNRSKQGFTLVELLVVIAIIGTLVGLLLPAVNAARESARRISCTSSQRQVGLAMKNFNGTNGSYPGYSNNVGGLVASWVIPLTPFMEQQAILDKWNEGVPAVVVLPLLICPSDPPTQPNQASLSYGMNCGTPDVASNGRVKKRPADLAANGVGHDNFNKNTATKVGTDNITDGESNTILLSENLQALQWGGLSTNNSSVQALAVPFPVSGENAAWQVEAATGIVWFPSQGTSPLLNRNINGDRANAPGDARRTFSNPIEELNWARPSSNHPGGVVVTFCDDHTIFISDGIDYHVYAQLMTTNSGQSDLPKNVMISGSNISWHDYILNAADYTN